MRDANTVQWFDGENDPAMLVQGMRDANTVQWFDGENDQTMLVQGLGDRVTVRQLNDDRILVVVDHVSIIISGTSPKVWAGIVL